GETEAEFVDQVRREIVVGGYDQHAILSNICSLGNIKRLRPGGIEVLPGKTPEDQSLLPKILVAANIELVGIVTGVLVDDVVGRTRIVDVWIAHIGVGKELEKLLRNRIDGHLIPRIRRAGEGVEQRIVQEAEVPLFH